MSELFEKLIVKLLPESATSRSMIFLFLLMVGVLSAAYFFYGKSRESVEVAAPVQSSLGRDYSRSPLNMSDAYQYCVLEAEKQLGPALQRYAMDSISSLYRQEQDVFFIVLKVDVGSVHDYREAAVYCNVDPKSYMVSYYKEVYPGENRSILSRTIEFFSKL